MNHVTTTATNLNESPAETTGKPVPSSLANGGGSTVAPAISAREPASANRAARRKMQEIYAPIAPAIAMVERRIAGELQSPFEQVAEVLRHGTQLGGKRLRPALMLLAAEATGGWTDDHITLGAVIELVHTATLVHDDVLDEADTRRHVETINARFDRDTAILLGDFLFARSYRLAASLPTPDAARSIAEAAERVCLGELRQVIERNVLELDEDTYIDLIRGKTAELCRAACELGVRHAGGSDRFVRELGEYGDSLGIAFQIADDYLDLWGDDGRVGKTLGTDLAQGKTTLPIIRLYQTANDDVRAAMHAIMRMPPSERTEPILERLEASDAKRYTAEVARTYRDRALAALRTLPSGSARESLEAIAYFAVDRSF